VIIQPSQPLAPRIVARAIAVALATVGVYESVGLPRYLAGGDWSVIGFIFATSFIFLCLVVAYHGWFFRTARSIRWLCGLGAFVAFGLLLTATDKAVARFTGLPLIGSPTQPLDPRSAVLRAIFSLLPAILAILFYHLMVGWLLRRLGLVDDRRPSQRLRAAKMSLGLIAFLIFASGNELDLLQTHQNHGPGIRDTAILFAPLVLAVGVYKLGMYFAGRRINRTAPAEKTENVTPPPAGPTT
jgi:hypothetical protein